MYTFENLDIALIGMSREILANGVWRTVRGFRCREIPHPVTICLTNPTDRYCTIAERKWNKYLPWAESLWMALGLNDLDALPGHYVKNLYKYTDKGTFWRGGYGPRLRAYSGLATDYAISDPAHRDIVSGHVKTVDQLDYVIKSLQRDHNTRQAIITLGDPVKDHFEVDGTLKVTNDYPCSRTLQFMVNEDGDLDCILYIRSNDLLYGFSAVNVTNFTLMQEYVANILGLDVGRYYHIAANLHMYEDQTDRIKQLANLDIKHYQRDVRWQYEDHITDLELFDTLCDAVYTFERSLVNGMWNVDFDPPNDMFNDWLKVFRHHVGHHVEFKNPHLQDLFRNE